VSGGAFRFTTEQERSMGWIRWFTRNRADTRPPTHADLAPLAVPGPLPEAVAAVAQVAKQLPRWAIVSAGTDSLHLTRTTRLFRFVDDIRLTAEPGPDGSTRVHATSQSRVGVGDLGQNRRNILELWTALQKVGVARQ
jgi:uncharacterized protein (DUF1499 family)